MRAARVGRLLLALGLVVGTAAGVGMLLGFEPARLPAALLNIAAYKLTFVAALGLLAGGATFLRYARREETRDAATLAPANELMALAEGQPADPAPGTVRQPERVRVTPTAGKDDQ